MPFLKAGRFSAEENSVPVCAAQNGSGDPPQLWEKAVALERLEGDEDLLRELCHIFLQESPKFIRELARAVAEGDCESIQRAAHSLKGEVSYLAANRATEAARYLESLAKDKDLSQAATAFALLERELDGLRALIEQCYGACP